VAEVTDYTIKIWTGWTADKPERLLHSYSGIIEWSPNEYRDGGWTFISLADKEIIWTEDDYYVEIHYEGDGYFYFFDNGIYSDNTAEGMSYYRANSNATCMLLSNVPTAENGDWNIRAVLSEADDFSPLSTDIPEIPQKHEIYSNYPNPFNPVTTLSIYLANSSAVSYSVFNLRGRQIIQKKFTLLGGGRHGFEVNMKQFSSGVYFYQFTINNQEYSPYKMVLLK
jgi:hypothetical protein